MNVLGAFFCNSQHEPSRAAEALAGTLRVSWGSGIPNRELKERAVAAESQPTTYGQFYVVDTQHDYSVDPRQGGGYWNKAQTPAALAEHKPFLGQSTYQAEIAKQGCRDAAAAAQTCSIQSARDSAAQQLVIKPGFLTRYTAATLPLTQKLGSAAPASSTTGHDISISEGSQPTESTHGAGRHTASAGNAASQAGACTVLSRFDGEPLYRSMYTGEAPWATEELNRGTAKVSQHLPGFAGHVPSDRDLVLADASTRVRKEDALLYHCDQHSRGLVPGYTGHKPAHKAAVSLAPPPPTSATTQGAAHQEALRWGPTSAGPGAPLDSRKGVLGFFSSGSNGGALESEIGLAEAARFHQLARPYEGFMKVSRGSSTTKYGAKFTS
ncbi:hypothetical protein N2152v2_002355 [Parachlorella kessleri]